MIQFFIKRFLLKIGMTDEQAEAVSAYIASLFGGTKLKPLEGDELHKAQLETMERRTPGTHE